MNHTWPDGTRKSTGNAFNWRNYQRDEALAHSITLYQRQAETSTRLREEAEANGVHTATVRGLKGSRNSLDPRQFHIYSLATSGGSVKRRREFSPRKGSLTSQVLEYLKVSRGPIFPQQIDSLFGVDRANQANKLKPAIDAGWLRKVWSEGRRGYALGSGA